MVPMGYPGGGPSLAPYPMQGPMGGIPVSMPLRGSMPLPLSSAMPVHGGGSAPMAPQGIPMPLPPMQGSTVVPTAGGGAPVQGGVPLPPLPPGSVPMAAMGGAMHASARAPGQGMQGARARGGQPRAAQQAVVWGAALADGGPGLAAAGRT